MGPSGKDFNPKYSVNTDSVWVPGTYCPVTTNCVFISVLGSNWKSKAVDWRLCPFTFLSQIFQLHERLQEIYILWGSLEGLMKWPIEVNGALAVLVIKYLVAKAYLECLHFLLGNAFTLNERQSFGAEFYFSCIFQSFFVKMICSIT